MTEGSEPTPWVLGSLCAAASAVLVAVAVGALGTTLEQISTVFAVVIVVVVVAGPAPSLLRRRHDPVWRWLIHGAAAGAVVGVVAFAVDVFS